MEESIILQKEAIRHILKEKEAYQHPQHINKVDVGVTQHLSLHRTYGSRIRRYIHIGEHKL